jgi:hypothetical protein
VLILSTLAFGAVFGAATVTVAFETIVLEGAPAFGETLTMGAALALSKDFAGQPSPHQHLMKLQLRLLMPQAPSEA